MITPSGLVWASSWLASSARRLPVWMLTHAVAALCGMWILHQWHEARSDAQHVRALERIRLAEQQGIRRAQAVDRKYQAELRRLRATAAGRTGGLHDRNASGTGHTVSAPGGATGWRLSNEAGAFLRSEADRADELKAWADACWQYVQQK
nr:MAG TPA: hypothetical protein [Caudoviricetes sp.]